MANPSRSECLSQEFYPSSHPRSPTILRLDCSCSHVALKKKHPWWKAAETAETDAFNESKAAAMFALLFSRDKRLLRVRVSHRAQCSTSMRSPASSNSDDETEGDMSLMKLHEALRAQKARRHLCTILSKVSGLEDVTESELALHASVMDDNIL
ncbi:unnamed protein product [Dicrocoelium dendriticum]|nr:unnamed protein product [Dicrocoelium dendriticum]